MAGPAPTFLSCWDQFGKYVKLWDEIDKFGNSNTANVLAMYDDLQANVDGEYIPSAINSILSDRATFASALADTRVASITTIYLREMLRAIDDAASTGDSNTEMLKRVRQYMVDNSHTLKSRNMTLGSSAAVGSPTGDGTIRRLSTDKDANTIETVGPETLTFTVDSDQQSGAQKHAEVFLVRGGAADPDDLEWSGSGASVGLTALNTVSTTIIDNSSFETHGATVDDTAPASLTSITNWTIGSSAANYSLRSNASYVYRGYPGEPDTLWGLEVTGDDSITQVLSDVNPAISFDPNTPYFVRVAWKRVSTATGTLTLDFGVSQASVDVSTADADTWSHLFIALDEDSWHQNFNQDSIDMVLTTTSIAGSIVLDDIVVSPMTLIGGSWYVADGGDVAWLRDDQYTVASSDDSTRAKMQYWLWRAFGYEGWMPTTVPATEITAAGGRTLTFADDDPDTITASTGSFVSDGYIAGMKLTVAGTSSNNGTYTIDTVAALVLTLVASDTLAAEGPLSATATLNGASTITDPS